MLKELLAENGGISCVRAMALLAVIFAGIIGILGLVLNKDLNQISILTGVFITSAFGGKVWQKKYEKQD